MKVNKFYKLALIFTGLSCVNVALSQDYNFAVKGEYEMPGFGNSRAYDDQGIEEIIDPFTGGLKLVVRDLHLPGNGGLDISVLRFYNSLQSPYNPQSALYNQPNPPGTALTGRSVVGLGWDMHFGGFGLISAIQYRQVVHQQHAKFKMLVPSGILFWSYLMEHASCWSTMKERQRVIVIH